jgi:cysteine desulfurase/selenocysteine lyase
MKTTFSAMVEGGDINANAAIARELKKEYPIFRTLPNLIYLDNAATTQKPLSVLDAERNFYMQSCANVHRAIHTIGEEATACYEKARSSMAQFIGATPKELIFTHGTTESINLVARTFGETLREGDEIILSVMEHHANMVPWQQLAERRGVVLKFIPVTDLGELDLAEYEKLISLRTRLVAVTMVSNVLGTINPIDRIVAAARSAGVPVLLDAAQAAPSMPLDVKVLGADFVAFSGHKMYGPFGIGILWGSETMLDSMPPFLGGGDMISEVRLEGFSVNELPYKFEAGTPPIAQAIGLEKAAEWLSGVGLKALGEYESALAQRFLKAIKDIPGLRILGDAPQRAGIVAFTLENAHAHDVAAYLDRRGIAVRAGHHCAHPLARRFGIVSSARASFGVYNLPEDVDAAAQALADAQEAL